MGSLKVQDVGGKEELSKIVSKVIFEQIDALIASDLDFSIFGPDHVVSDSVIYTYGHSIENSFLCDDVICKVIKSHGRIKNDPESRVDCNNWILNFFQDFHDLIIFDILNVLKSTGLDVVGDNCTRFMKSQLSPASSAEKIKTHMVKFKLNEVFDVHKVEIEEKITQSKRISSDFIRGHFLFSAALKYTNHRIKSARSSKNISVNAFFSSAILAFETVFNEQHPHFNHYSSEIQRLNI